MSPDKPHPIVFIVRGQAQPIDTTRGAAAAVLPQGAVSRWHRVTSDEVWHLYEGGPLEVLSVDPAFGALSRHKLESHAPVCTVGAAHWQAARTLGDYALVGCTVGPGFDFEDFTILANDAESAVRLLALDPELASLV